MKITASYYSDDALRMVTACHLKRKTAGGLQHGVGVYVSFALTTTRGLILIVYSRAHLGVEEDTPTVFDSTSPYSSQLHPPHLSSSSPCKQTLRTLLMKSQT